MKIQNTLVYNIRGRSQRYFAHVTTVSLSWRVQNIVVIGRVYSKLEHSEFSSNFEFDRNMLSGTGASSVMSYTCRQSANQQAHSYCISSHLHQQQESFICIACTLLFRSGWGIWATWTQLTGAGNLRMVLETPFELTRARDRVLPMMFPFDDVIRRIWKCRKSYLYCTAICTSSIGQNCENSCQPESFDYYLQADTES